MPQGTREHLIGHFENPEQFLAGLTTDVTASLVTAAADVVLVVDGEGIIRDLAFGSDELMRHGYQAWLGQAWAQTVTIESRPKVEAMLADARSGSGSRWRQVNHPSADGADLPLSYSVVPARKRGKAKGVESGHTMAFGRDLRALAAMQQRLVSAQLSMERDYWRLRHLETRYRLLFQVSSDAVLILDATTEKLEDANPAAYALLGDDARRTGWTLADSLDAAGQATLKQVFVGLLASGRAAPVSVRLAGGTDEMTLSVSLFREEKSSHFLVRITAPAPVATPEAAVGKRLLVDAVEHGPDAFVVSDLQGRILTANRAFLELAQVSNEELVRGESLDRWLGRGNVELNVLITTLRQRGAVRLFATSLRGEYGLTVDVEISAVAVTEGEQPCLGFAVRDVSRRLSDDARVGKELPRSAGQMTELVGRVPLKDIVRETTDLIEQLCIEAALELTGDNRASAAEMLGLSRQSLYVKLRRFGIGDTVAEG